MATKRNGRRVRGFDEPAPVPVVLGLDLSLRFTCMAAVPGDWGGKWSKVATARAGESLERNADEHKRIRRLQYIVDDVVRFAESTKTTHVFLEQYALRAPMGKGAIGALAQAHAIGELGGAIKVELQERMRLPIVVVAPATARKLFGKQPRSGSKEWAAQRLLEAGAPKDWIGTSEDRWGIFDAFTQANWGLSEHGGQAIVLREQTELFR